MEFEVEETIPTLCIEQCDIINDVPAAPTKHLPRRQVIMMIKLIDQSTESM